MKNNLCIFLLGIVIFISITLCGCQSNQVEDNTYEDIFESDVVTLINYSLDLNENKSGVITKATINGIIKNSVDRKISVNITAEFYNNNDYLLGKSWYKINNMPIDYQTTFTIIYNKNNVADVNRIKLKATEL